MPHAADGRLQLSDKLSWREIKERWFQCRTRQMVGCNNLVNKLKNKLAESFNAARGRWSVATERFKMKVTKVIVSIPHAAGGRLQQFSNARSDAVS